MPAAKLVQPAAAAVGRKAATTMKLDLPSIAAGLAPAVLASPAFAAGALCLLGRDRFCSRVHARVRVGLGLRCVD